MGRTAASNHSRGILRRAGPRRPARRRGGRPPAPLARL